MGDVRGGGTGETHVALEGHAAVDAEEQDDVAAGVEGVGEQALVLLLRRPQAVFHRLRDVFVVPGLDHEVADACEGWLVRASGGSSWQFGRWEMFVLSE